MPDERAKKPNHMFTYDLLHPKPRRQPIVNIDFVRSSLSRDTGDKSVDVWQIQKGDILATIIVMQEFLLTEPHQLGGPLPEVTEGEQEDLVRQWLEKNGEALLTNIPFDPRSIVFSQVLTRVNTRGRSATTLIETWFYLALCICVSCLLCFSLAVSSIVLAAYAAPARWSFLF